MSADLDAALASTKLFKQQLEEALAIRDGNKGASSMAMQTNDDAIDDIAAPFTLCADAVVERTNENTGDLVYEVEKEGKVIYSTVTRPLAFAFLAGVNAVPVKAAKGTTPKSEGGEPKTEPETASPDRADKPSPPVAASKPAARKRSVL
jgi:hypothetical protein